MAYSASRKAVDTNLEELRKALGLYMRASGMSMEEVLRKKGAQLGYQLKVEFRQLAPVKGSVRAERLAALKRGEGVYVRPSVYAAIQQKYNALPLAAGVMRWRTKGGEIKGTTARGLNLQALAVQRELNLRESGRGFVSHSAAFATPGANWAVVKSNSKYNRVLASMGFRHTGSGSALTLEWGGWGAMSEAAAHGIARDRGQAAVARAIDAVTLDMAPYLESHLNLTAAQMGLRTS
jgi:hypothetical protein